MPFVERDSSGKIIAARLTPSESASEWIDADAAELTALTDSPILEDPRASLEYTDQGLIRVLEDLIDTLLAKDVIRFTDLPLPAQNRLLQRRSLRNSLNSNANLLDDDGGLL